MIVPLCDLASVRPTSAARAAVLAHHPSHSAEANQLGTCEGVADAGHRLNGVLTIAHAVWPLPVPS